METTFAEILAGLVKHPAECMLVIAMIAIVFLVKQLLKLNDEHKATMEKVIPVAIKLGDAAIAVEKTTERLERLMERERD